MAITLFSTLATTAPAAEPTNILARVASWERVNADVRRNVRLYGAEHVVVAVDFDNTTARIPTYVGSDAWYRDQLATGRNRDEIHAQLENIFATTPHVLIDRFAPQYLRIWQDLGVRVVILTARSPRFHDVTQREALRLGLDFSRTAPKSNWDGRDVDLVIPASEGLERVGTVAYRNGMIHCGDVDKGTVLRAFLHAADLDPKAVVVADDRPHHLAEVGGAYVGSHTDLRLILIDDGLEPKTPEACALALAAGIKSATKPLAHEVEKAEGGK